MYSLNLETGSIMVSNDYIRDTVKRSVSEVDEVIANDRALDRIKDIMTRSSNVSINDANNGIEITVDVVTRRGINLKQLGLTIQEKIKHDLEEVAGIAVIAINIKFTSII